MEISEQAMQLLHDGGLTIEFEAVVLNARTFKAAGKDVAKVTVVGTKHGPMGNNSSALPTGSSSRIRTSVFSAAWPAC